MQLLKAVACLMLIQAGCHAQTDFEKAARAFEKASRLDPTTISAMKQDLDGYCVENREPNTVTPQQIWSLQRIDDPVLNTPKLSFRFPKTGGPLLISLHELNNGDQGSEKGDFVLRRGLSYLISWHFKDSIKPYTEYCWYRYPFSGKP